MSWAGLPPNLRTIAERDLTRKQLDVLKLTLAGWGTRRIANYLGVAEPTARAHRDAAYRKLAPYLDQKEAA